MEALVRQMSDQLKSVEEVFDTPSSKSRANQIGIPEEEFLDAIWAQVSVDDLLAVINKCGYEVRVTLEPIHDA